MEPKATCKPAQPRALPHGKKDGPRRTPKHVADPAAYKDIYTVPVGDIIAERMAKKHKEWLVRWKGFSHEDDTWEPLEHLGGCEQCIARFEEECDHQPSLRCSLSSAYCFLVPSIIAICKTRVTTPLQLLYKISTGRLWLLKILTTG